MLLLNPERAIVYRDLTEKEVDEYYEKKEYILCVRGFSVEEIKDFSDPSSFIVPVFQYSESETGTLNFPPFY